jgi:hypothetical protein
MTSPAASTSSDHLDEAAPHLISLDEFEQYRARRDLLRGVGELLPLLAVLLGLALVMLML